MYDCEYWCSGFDSVGPSVCEGYRCILSSSVQWFVRECGSFVADVGLSCAAVAFLFVLSQFLLLFSCRCFVGVASGFRHCCGCFFVAVVVDVLLLLSLFCCLLMLLLLCCGYCLVLFRCCCFFVAVVLGCCRCCWFFDVIALLSLFCCSYLGLLSSLLSLLLLLIFFASVECCRVFFLGL